MKPQDQAPPPRSPVFRRIGTQRRETAHDVFKAIYGSKFDADFATGADDFALNYTIAPLDRIVLLKADVSDFDCVRETESALQIFVPVSGTLIQKCDVATLDGDPKTATIVRPFGRTRHIVQKGSALVLTIPVADLLNRLELMTGKSAGADINAVLAGSADLSAPAAAALARTMKHVFSELINLERAGLTSLVQSSYQELLTRLAVPVLIPGSLEALEAPGRDCGSSVLHMARDYIAEHATDVIELAQLAASLGISMRTLQVNFLKMFGFSPRDYIIECRLVLARKLLSGGCTSRSVTDIGLECGFSNLGHFAAKYRDKFGELPSETLRRSQS